MLGELGNVFLFFCFFVFLFFCFFCYGGFSSWAHLARSVGVGVVSALEDLASGAVSCFFLLQQCSFSIFGL